jgi:MFS family permease
MTTTAPTYTPVQREKVYRHNFPLFLMDSILFSLAMGILGPTTVIPDFVGQLTNSEILIGFSGSLFEIGWLLPQLFVARYLIRFENKKMWFIFPNIPSRLILLLFSGFVVWLGAGHPTAILIAFFICYSTAGIGDGIVGVSWADLIGTSLDARWRARLFGITSAVAGITMLLVVSPFIQKVLGDSGPDFPVNYALLFAASGSLFAISIIPTLFIRELPGGKAVSKVPSFSEFLPQLKEVLRTDAPFRSIVITRVLMALFAMASPFYIGFATEKLGLTREVAVPTLLATQAIGTIVGAVLYTWIAARQNLLYIRIVLATALLLPITALLSNIMGSWLLYVGFFSAGMSLSNLFASFMNWVMTYSHPDNRPIYAGLFNTVAAVVSLTSPFISGSIVRYFGHESLFIFVLFMGVAAWVVTIKYVTDPQKETNP